MKVAIIGLVYFGIRIVMIVRVQRFEHFFTLTSAA